MAYFVFLCGHCQEIMFDVLKRKYMTVSGRKLLSPGCRQVSKEKEKINAEKETTKLYIAADVHSSPEYYDFYWSKNFQCQSIPHMRIIVTKAL